MRRTISIVLLKLVLAPESPGGAVKTQIARPNPCVSNSGDSRWGRRICISNKYPGDADAAGPAITP